MIYNFGFFQYKQNKHFLSWILPSIRAREDLIHSSPHSIPPRSDAFLLRSERWGCPPGFPDHFAAHVFQDLRSWGKIPGSGSALSLNKQLGLWQRANFRLAPFPPPL